MPAVVSKGNKGKKGYKGNNDDDNENLFEQQRFCRAYLQHDGPYRGLLLYHGLGSGKTCSAIAIAESLQAVAGRIPGGVFVFVTAALERSYIGQVRFCGRRIFRQSQGWRKVTAPDEVERIVASGSWVGPKLVKRLEGIIWVPSSFSDSSTSNNTSKYVQFSAITSESDREAIDACIDDAIRRTHRFVHYNGLNENLISALLSERNGRPFDDSIVIIDEAHNFVSNLDSGKQVKHIYDALMDARRCKVVLLSGTPLVNQAVELAWLVNLAHGPVRVHEVKVGPGGIDDAMEVTLKSAKARHVHSYWEPIWNVSKIGSLMLQLLPDGFVRAPTDVSGTFVKRDNANLSDRERIQETLGVLGLPGSLQFTEHRFEVLPSDPDAFNAMFVREYTRLDPQKESLLARRCLGTISYFPGHDESLYPAIRAIHDVRVPLSPRQFSEYTAVRAPEKRAEVAAANRRKSGKGDGGSSDESGGVGMRTESRAVCTFVYPEAIPRPRRAHMRDMMDDSNRAYSDALDAALVKLRSSDALVKSKLASLSPKFSKIVDALSDLAQGKGSAIVYSQFRKAEGIDVLAAALDANGFAELRIERDPASHHIVVRPMDAKKASAKHRYLVYSNDDPLVTDVVLSLFNNRVNEVSALVRKSLERMGLPLTNIRGELATALLITSSGAEGINTRNVRQVHVIEPFWHRNRLDQVIGRARRAHSHDDLPPKERFIDVYVYSATFTEEQKGITRDTLKDGELTSDEFVQDVAKRKHALLSQVLKLMQQVAVDCTEGCWKAPTLPSSSSASPNDPLYAADIRDNVANRLA